MINRGNRIRCNLGTLLQGDRGNMPSMHDETATPAGRIRCSADSNPWSLLAVMEGKQAPLMLARADIASLSGNRRASLLAALEES